MKRIFVPVLLIVLLAACRGNKKEKDSLDKPVTVNAGLAETQALEKRFKPMLQGFWINKDYIDEIKETKSAQRAYDKVGPITDMFIDSLDVKSDSILVDYNASFHEVFNLVIKFQSGTSQNSILAHDPYRYIDRKKYEMRFNKTGSELTIYTYNNSSKFVDSLHLFKLIDVDKNGHRDETGILVNRILVSGNYLFTDSIRKTFEINLTDDGKITGWNAFKRYSIGTDFMTPPNNTDEIFLGVGEKMKDYSFKINADTLNIYEATEAADTIRIGKLKYKLVRQK